MEVGAVKQDFNNEVIQLKKSLNQAKTQTIHNLTRKAKTLTEKKCPEHLKEKSKRKAESAVREVLIIKKIKASDIARFIVTHTGKLNEFLNKPTIDNNKACARLLLHKALQEKYKLIRGKFSNISIKDLFMSRQERLKLKKEEIEKRKNKNKRKEENKKKRLANAVNVQGDWDVETTDKSKDKINKNLIVDDQEMFQDNDSLEGDDLSKRDNLSESGDLSDDDREENNSVVSDKSDVDDENDVSSNTEQDNDSNNVSDIKHNDNSSSSDNDEDDNDEDDNDEDDKDEDDNDEEEQQQEENDIIDRKNNKSDVLNRVVKNNSKSKVELNLNKPESEVFELKMNLNNKTENKVKKADKKVKDVSKNKNLKDKLQKRKFDKESEDLETKTKKVLVDNFFVTSSGNNYKSLVEPRNPDEVKDEHKSGNRKYRRAAMFGHVLKTRPKKNGYQSSNNNNNFKKKSSYNTRQFFTDQNNVKEDNNRQFDSRKNNFNSKAVDRRDAVPEKLHPSWEAKKKQSAMLPFQGKKVVFDES